MSADTRTFSQEDVNQIVEDRLARERRSRSTDAKVTSEPRVYALDSPHSYFGDRAAVAVDPSGTTHPGAHERLGRYAAELGHEIEQGTPEGRCAERIIHEHARVEDPVEHERRAQAWVRETRALTTGGGITAATTSGASAFVPPFFVLDEWALFRGAERAFADQCHQLPLPPFGMQVYVPAFTSTDTAAVQTEGAGVTETDPATALQSGTVQNVSGQITITQQLDDRGFGMGGAIDRLIGLQLKQQLDQAIDVYALTQAITNGAAVAGNATYTTANLYTDIAKGREQLTDTAGTRMRPTHIFTTSDLYSFATRQVDSSARPIITPQYAPGYNPLSDVNDGQNGGTMPKWARFSGTILPGGVFWFLDDNIPASGANTQIVVSAPDAAVLLMESPQPILSVWPQTVGQNLQIVLNLRKYVVAVTRHATGTATITSAGYPTSAV